ncbi:MAG: ParB/RepB/Spo0J family partition protein, partial [Candidatus Saccharimonadaceae bacterium]
YVIVAGERRYRAATMAGLDKIPALVRTLSNQHRLEVSLIENLQRTDLNVMEKATAYLKLRDQFNLTLDQIGQRLGGRSMSAVSNTLRLLRLPKFVQKLIVKGDLREGQVRPLIGLDEDVLKAIVPKIITEEWSARKIEQFIVELKKSGGKNADAEKAKQVAPTPYRTEVESLKKRLDSDIVVKSNARGAGQIVIKFRDDKDFHRISQLLGT